MDITPDLTAIPTKRSRESNPAEPGAAAAATEGAEDFSAHLPEGKQTRAHKQTDQHARPDRLIRLGKRMKTEPRLRRWLTITLAAKISRCTTQRTAPAQLMAQPKRMPPRHPTPLLYRHQ